MDKVDIPFNKLKLIGLILIGLIFFILSGTMVYKPYMFVSKIFRSEALILCAGIFGLVSSLYFLLLFSTKTIDYKSGIKVNDKGIFENTTFSSLGLLKWSDIQRIEVYTLMSNRFILVFLKNPQDYFNSQKNILKRMLSYLNNVQHKTPVLVNPNTLDCTFEELESAIREGFERYKREQNN